MDQEERAKLKVLLEYWIKHNREHGEEFEEWSERARGLYGGVVSSGLIEARDCMLKASQSLSRVMERLRADQ
ncbi:MAG: hypothetical protein IBX68_08070 [Dehalococcoidia bacterium]|nr:hypothetical protein [Dehalococcoidia bacterium]